MSKRIITAIIVVAIGIGGFYFLMNKNEGKSTVRQNQNLTMQNKEMTRQDKEMTLYKSPNCSCCLGYADELKKQGFDVKVVVVDDMNTITKKYGIPADRQSCHTIIIGKYFIEGHVPMEAVKRLLKERPAINGIGLSGMPAGTPGMPGKKLAPYKIYQSVNGKFSEYMTI